MDRPKNGKDAESVETPEGRAFEDAMRRVLSVPKDGLEKIKRETAAKRSPKPKVN